MRESSDAPSRLRFGVLDDSSALSFSLGDLESMFDHFRDGREATGTGEDFESGAPLCGGSEVDRAAEPGSGALENGFEDDDDAEVADLMSDRSCVLPALFIGWHCAEISLYFE